MADTATTTSRKKPASRHRTKPAEKEEPKVKWEKSKAKQLLYKDILEGRVPRNATTADGKSTMPLKSIYELRPEFQEYLYSKFSSRLSSLRKTIKDRSYRANLDQEAFDNYKANNPVPAAFSHKGYIQWQGSEAQALCREDIEHGLHKSMSRMELFGSRSEYYKNFPLKEFRDKVRQEIRTAKYLHTLAVKGKDPRK